MSAGQMVLHLSGAFSMALPEAGAAPLQSTPSRFNSALGRHLALGTPFPWPRNVPTIPQLDATRQPVPLPDAFDQNVAELLTHIRHFSAAPASSLLPEHPFLGPMTYQQWMRWGYLHTDHHLRQFGC